MPVPLRPESHFARSMCTRRKAPSWPKFQLEKTTDQAAFNSLTHRLRRRLQTEGLPGLLSKSTAGREWQLGTMPQSMGYGAGSNLPRSGPGAQSACP